MKSKPYHLVDILKLHAQFYWDPTPLALGKGTNQVPPSIMIIGVKERGQVLFTNIVLAQM